jgi:hypothetical protein
MTCLVSVRWFENAVHDLLGFSHLSLRVAGSTAIISTHETTF